MSDLRTLAAEARIQKLEDRISAHHRALNEAIELRHAALLGTTFGLLQCALGVFVFVIAVKASETWLKLFGLHEPLLWIVSLIVAGAASLGVMRLVSGYVVRLKAESMKSLPMLPIWQERENG